MKILAIRGKNLASLEDEFEIDFTSEPLKSAGIFAITGQTGAGKSTILDALCLALFDDAPRLNKAEASVNVFDVDDKTITQKDSRNILRRGTSEGYAEVDFIALNGDKYRSKWMVRRARGKSDGALQATSMKVVNLTTGSDEQGTKGNLLARISELIGLTFDQFTRAVLLAQGDFANFLKAKSNEKAELLEKLTGTEIYSKISATIYQKATEAKQALELLQQRIKDIRLLTEEELDALQKEKVVLEKELSPLKSETSVIEKKLTWIKQQEQLIQEIAQAEDDLKKIQQKIQEARPRYDYISAIDASQEIRDSYVELENKKRKQLQLETELSTKEKELQIMSEQLKKIIADLDIAKTSLDASEKKYEILKPEINRAKELDIKIQTLKEKLSEINSELETYKKQLSVSEQNIGILKGEQTKIAAIKDSLTKWFKGKVVYESIVSHIDIISTQIANAKTAKTQKEDVETNLNSSKSLLVTYTEQLEQLEAETKRLNILLPTEIIELRSKLEDGKPCPICGSTHHPLRNEIDQAQQVSEQEIEQAKQKNTENITQIKSGIEKTQKTITEFEVHIKNFDNQYDKAYNSLKEYLKSLPDWESKFSKGVLQAELTSISSQWNENKVKLESCISRNETTTVKIEAEEKAKLSIAESLSTKATLYQSQDKFFTEFKEQRKQLLEGKSVEDIEKLYSEQKQKFSSQYEQLRSTKEKIGTQKSTILGGIAQLKSDTTVNKQTIAELSTTVNNWIESNKYKITLDLLKDLIAKSREWISQEKQYLAELKNKELITKTTLDERNNRLSKHSESEDKPEENQTKDILSQLLLEINAKSEIASKRLNEIEVALMTHTKGKEQIKSFETDLNEKSELYENWAKLNDLLGSANGNKFKTIAQGYTLDVLLSYANKHLEELTKRYQLEKIPETLALQVVDNDMLGEVRTVHSLSGGESFLISLALALGLSSLSSNRMKIESLFIDEGFGALDIDTLSIAMDALDNLQTQGRKIGVISHVEEMKERITTQIQVVKAANGRSFVKLF